MGQWKRWLQIFLTLAISVEQPGATASTLSSASASRLPHRYGQGDRPLISVERMKTILISFYLYAIVIKKSQISKIFFQKLFLNVSML